MVRWWLGLGALSLIVGAAWGTTIALASRVLDPMVPVPEATAQEAAEPILSAAAANGWVEQNRLHTDLSETAEGQLALPHVPLAIGGGRCAAAVAWASGQLAVTDVVIGTHTDLPAGACAHGHPDFVGNVSGLTPGEGFAFGRTVSGGGAQITHDGMRHADVAVLCFEEDTTDRQHRFVDVDLKIILTSSERERGSVTLVLFKADREDIGELALPRPGPIDSAAFAQSVGAISNTRGFEEGTFAALIFAAIGGLVLLFAGYVRRRRATARALADVAADEPKTF